jgi:RND family efflux transporter MFP subunit
VSLGGSGSRGAIVTLAALDSLDVEVDVNEAYIGRLRLGQAADVVTDAYPDTAFAARIRQIVPTSDRQRATVLVKTEILRPDARLLPEMGAKVTFLNPAAPPAAPMASRVTVAAAALQRDGATVYVWVIGGENRVERRTVEVGAAHNGRVEILSGLDGGEKLVLQSSRPLRAGARVQFAS